MCRDYCASMGCVLINLWGKISYWMSPPFSKWLKLQSILKCHGSRKRYPRSGSRSACLRARLCGGGKYSVLHYLCITTPSHGSTHPTKTSCSDHSTRSCQAYLCSPWRNEPASTQRTGVWISTDNHTYPCQRFLSPTKS